MASSEGSGERARDALPDLHESEPNAESEDPSLARLAIVAGNIWQFYCQPWHCYFSLSVMECHRFTTRIAKTRRTIELGVGACERRQGKRLSP
jgi:hypothetical protein